MRRFIQVTKVLLINLLLLAAINPFTNTQAGIDAWSGCQRRDRDLHRGSDRRQPAKQPGAIRRHLGKRGVQEQQRRRKLPHRLDKNKCSIYNNISGTRRCSPRHALQAANGSAA